MTRLSRSRLGFPGRLGTREPLFLPDRGIDCDADTIIHLDGRSVGKTINLTTDVLYYMLTNPGVHLSEILDKLS